MLFIIYFDRLDLLKFKNIKAYDYKLINLLKKIKEMKSIKLIITENRIIYYSDFWIL